MTYVYVPKALDSLEMDTAIAEIKSLIRQGFPEATFSVGPGEDPVGIYLVAEIDLDDLGEVNDLFLDGLVDMQVEEMLPLYVIPTRPIERTREMIRRERERMPWLQQGA